MAQAPPKAFSEFKKDAEYSNNDGNGWKWYDEGQGNDWKWDRDYRSRSGNDRDYPSQSGNDWDYPSRRITPKSQDATPKAAPKPRLTRKGREPQPRDNRVNFVNRLTDSNAADLFADLDCKQGEVITSLDLYDNRAFTVKGLRILLREIRARELKVPELSHTQKISVFTQS